MTHWRFMVVGRRYFVESRTDDMDHWQRECAAATRRHRPARRFLARRTEAGRIYILRER